jgi:hypothetical protein
VAKKQGRGGCGMEIIVDLEANMLSVEGIQDLQRFNLRVKAYHSVESGGRDGSRNDNLKVLTAMLMAYDVGYLDDSENAYVAPDAIRKIVRNVLDEEDYSEWERAFKVMLTYASSKGWIANDGKVQIHAEWD